MKFLAAFLLLFVSVASAQTDAPKPKFDRETRIELGINATLIGLDGATTRHVINNGGYEQNVLARPFVHSNVGQAFGCGLAVSANMFGDYLLRRHPWGHRILNLTVGVAEGYFVIHNSLQKTRP